MNFNELLRDSVILKEISNSVKTVFAAWENGKKKASDYFLLLDGQKAGVVVICSILVNLLLIALLKIETEPEWLVYRCGIVIIFLPWIFCKADLKEIARDSKLLSIFLRQ